MGNVKIKLTKNGTQMLTCMAEDRSGFIEVIAFNKTIEEGKALIKDMNVVQISGRLSVKEDEDPKLIADKFLLPAAKTIAFPKTCYISVAKADHFAIGKIENIAKLYPGNDQVVLFDRPTRKYYKCKQVRINLHKQCEAALIAVFGQENVVMKS